MSPAGSGYPMRKLGNRSRQKGWFVYHWQEKWLPGLLQGICGLPHLLKDIEPQFVHVGHPGNSTRLKPSSSPNTPTDNSPYIALQTPPGIKIRTPTTHCSPSKPHIHRMPSLQITASLCKRICIHRRDIRNLRLVLRNQPQPPPHNMLEPHLPPVPIQLP